MAKEGVKASLWTFIAIIYAEAGLEIPQLFIPEDEAKRVASALIAKGMGIRL